MEQTKDQTSLYEQDGRVYVRYGRDTYEIPARCPHIGGPLAQASLNGPFLRCVWHGATFDVRTGIRLRGPECADLAVRKVSPVADEDGAGWLS